MKYFFNILISFLIFAACSKTSTPPKIESAPEPQAEAQTQPENTPPPAPALEKLPLKDALGAYVGMFSAVEYKEDKKPKLENKINITIDEIGGGNIKGHSVVAGNSRPFVGTYKTSDERVFEVVAKEPGDDKYDGNFEFTLTLIGNDKQIWGKWTANDTTLGVTKRSYTLTPRVFAYDPNLNLVAQDLEVYDSYDQKRDEFEVITADAIKFNASATELKKEDVENMHKRDLEIMRNAIYARHGYSFKNRAMRDYFDNYVEWYIPVSTDVSNSLTELEKKNIELIKRYEQHAASYYDSFGR